MYTYGCEIRRVVDGDTVDVDIDLGFGIWIRGERVRLHGIDTPETRTRDRTEKAAGLLAKARVEALLPVGAKRRVTTYLDTGKYGRTLGRFSSDGSDVGEILVSERLAVPYTGGNRAELKVAHQANYAYLREQGLI